MFELKGKYNEATVYTDNLEPGAISQIIELCNQPHIEGSKIRIMPDAHQGAGSTIGTTMTIQDKVVPNLVGVDIGCGLEVAIVQVDPSSISFDEVDDAIRKYIPSGYSVNSDNRIHRFSKKIPFRDIKAPYNLKRGKASIGTLGGGNHFIEVNAYDDDHVAVVVHSGSRNLGKQIAEHYQLRAYDELTNNKQEREELIRQLKKEGREREINQALSKLPKTKVTKDLAYVEGEAFRDYLHDMRIAQMYANLNRKAMIDVLIDRMKWNVVDQFTTVHNYIDLDNLILRKGAISAQMDERVIIPMNMRDGSIIATGKGNGDWNYSAPHGAGRLMSRSKAKSTVSLEDFESSMKEVWSTSVGESTLDESPMAYKPMEEIVEHVQDTIRIERYMKPLYNFKAN